MRELKLDCFLPQICSETHFVAISESFGLNTTWDWNPVVTSLESWDAVRMQPVSCLGPSSSIRESVPVGV